MEDSSKNKYCNLDPNFPASEYVVALAISNIDSGELKYLFPMPAVYTSLDEIADSIEKTIEETTKNNLTRVNEILVLDTAILLPVYLYSRYPLKKEFWSSPTTHYDISDRIKLFNKVVSNPSLNMLLVTPTYYSAKERRWYLSATLPLSLSYQDRDIDEFMFTSDFPVDTRAKNAAIYYFGKPLKLRWETLEVEEVDSEPVKNYVIN